MEITINIAPGNLVTHRGKRPFKMPKQCPICGEERSTISPDYARNFICDFIIGKEQEHSERFLFDF